MSKINRRRKKGCMYRLKQSISDYKYNRRIAKEGKTNRLYSIRDPRDRQIHVIRESVKDE